MKKLLVHRDARGNGLGRRLMLALEEEAWRQDLLLLVLDTADRAAERLYETLGWQRAGEIPNFAQWPQGGLGATTFFWKALDKAKI